MVSSSELRSEATEHQSVLTTEEQQVWQMKPSDILKPVHMLGEGQERLLIYQGFYFNVPNKCSLQIKQDNSVFNSACLGTK